MYHIIGEKFWWSEDVTQEMLEMACYCFEASLYLRVKAYEALETYDNLYELIDSMYLLGDLHLKYFGKEDALEWYEEGIKYCEMFYEFYQTEEALQLLNQAKAHVEEQLKLATEEE